MNASNVFVLAAALAIALTGCATKRADEPQHDALQPPARTPYVASRIVQVGYGAAAHFAPCVVPACPLPTPKTFAPPAAQAMPSAEPAAAPGPSASASMAASDIDRVNP